MDSNLTENEDVTPDKTPESKTETRHVEPEFVSAGEAVGDYFVVDMGLLVKWATCNIGTSKPFISGKYFAWGEIESKYYYLCSELSDSSFRSSCR